MNISYETTVTRGRDGVEAKTVIDLGYDGRELHVTTCKRGCGGLSTMANVFTRTEGGSLTCVLFQDFHARLAEDRTARCTDKAIRTMHAQALDDIEAVLTKAKAQHPPKPAAAPKVRNIQGTLSGAPADIAALSREEINALPVEGLEYMARDASNAEASRIEAIRIDLAALDEPVATSFRFNGAVHSQLSMLSANKDDINLCEWLLTAKPGEIFSGCECVASSTADTLTDDVGPTHESDADTLPDPLDDFNHVSSRHHY